jgi:PAS domain S-box-containing protein
LSPDRDKFEGRQQDGFDADLVRSMRCGLITVDRCANVLSVNDLAARVLEIDPAQAVGQHVGHALAAHSHLARLMAEACSMATPPDRAEIEIRTRAGQGRSLGFTLSQVAAVDGQVRGAALFFKDLTPIERAEQRERLQERLAALGSMAASLAHEIRNPLAALELTTALLKRKLGDKGEVKDLLATLQQQVRRLSGTVETSLEYVRPLALARSPADLVSVLDAAVEAAAPTENAPKVEIVRHYSPGGVPVSVDSPRFHEALLNLIRNALEAMAERGGVLKLTLEVPSAAAPLPPGSFAQIRVGDTGTGIPDEIRPKIFNPFFSTKTDGSGLGLAWTRKVVDAHGGILDVESRPGEGTVFTIRLPLPSAATALELIPTGVTLHEAQDSGSRR